MDRFKGLASLVLCAALLGSPVLAQPAAPASSQTAMTGEMLNVQLFNVTPTTAVTLAFKGLRFTGAPVARPGSEAAVQGVSFQGSTIVFSPPQRSVAIGQFTTVSFSVGITMTGPVSGTATVHKPVVVTLSTSTGFVSTQDGPFTLGSSTVVPAAAPGHP
ncbi:MAG TPA: hypothetical protein VGS07_13450 [Thermoanaerobaculia bacterium]|jgi:hypothetical protein|nr:hypothetical protein [Thermoanaerobaculia bacterium]